MTRALQLRAWKVAATCAITMAFAGYFVGLRPPKPRVELSRPLAVANADRAPSYQELRELRRGPNAAMYAGAVVALSDDQHGSFDPATQTAEARQGAISLRASRRADDGAPPTIPHAIDQRSAPDCLSCHERGARIAGRVAPRPSHQRFDGCTQCHVVATDPRPTRAATPLFKNTFVGLASPERGDRAGPGAPPTIPHPTLMRGTCTSCHGPGGLHGLRTSHPHRQSCTQCHVPSAALDQRVQSTAGTSP